MSMTPPNLEASFRAAQSLHIAERVLAVGTFLVLARGRQPDGGFCVIDSRNNRHPLRQPDGNLSVGSTALWGRGGLQAELPMSSFLSVLHGSQVSEVTLADDSRGSVHVKLPCLPSDKSNPYVRQEHEQQLADAKRQELSSDPHALNHAAALDHDPFTAYVLEGFDQRFPEWPIALGRTAIQAIRQNLQARLA
jgi:hypothetical protein